MFYNDQEQNQIKEYSDLGHPVQFYQLFVKKA